MVDIPAKKCLIDGPIDRDNPRKVGQTVAGCQYLLDFLFVKKPWYCVGGRVKQKVRFIILVDKG